MAAIYLSAFTGEVVAVLADEAHPGRKVVEAEWNSRPFPRFRCVHVPGEDVREFADLQERDLETTVLINRIDFLPAQAALLASKRMITLPLAALRRRRRRLPQ